MVTTNAFLPELPDRRAEASTHEASDQGSMPAVLLRATMPPKPLAR
jgi:hypothetical protein